MTLTHLRTVPILRSYDEAKAREFYAELIARKYKNNRPGLERPDWGGIEFTVIDPVNNRITFSEADPA